MHQYLTLGHVEHSAAQLPGLRHPPSCLSLEHNVNQNCTILNLQLMDSSILYKELWHGIMIRLAYVTFSF